MARIFWKGFKCGHFPDGRIELLVELENRASGVVHWWTPRWSEVARLAQRAYEVEQYNETESGYEEMLGGARRTANALTRKKSSAKVGVGRGTDHRKWCWCPVGDLLDMEDELHRGQSIDGWHMFPEDCCHVCRDDLYHRV